MCKLCVFITTLCCRHIISAFYSNFPTFQGPGVRMFACKYQLHIYEILTNQFPWQSVSSHSRLKDTQYLFKLTLTLTYIPIHKYMLTHLYNHTHVLINTYSHTHTYSLIHMLIHWQTHLCSHTLINSELQPHSYTISHAHTSTIHIYSHIYLH